MKKKSILASLALLSAVIGMSSNASAAVLISDNFNAGGNGTNVVGTVTPVGSATWVGGTDYSPRFNGAGEVTNGNATATTSSAYVSLAGAPGGSTLFTISADAKPNGNAWSSLQFSTSVTDIFNAGLSVLYTSSGYYELFKNNFGVSLGAGNTVPNGGLNNFQLQYNSATDEASVWINSVNVINAVTVGATTPVMNYAGFGFYNAGATPSDTQFDNFQVNVVPEPSTFVLLGLGATASLLRRRRI